MQIDWFTFSAQIINFLVLVYLLHRFLYGPVQRSISEREAAIRQQIEEAERRQQAADEQATHLRRQQREWDETREQMLRETRHETYTERERLLQEAKQSVEEKRDEWLEMLAHEQADFDRAIRKRAATAGIQVAQRLLIELANADLNPLIIKRFRQRLQELDQATREQIIHLLGQTSGWVAVQASHALTDDDLASLTATLNEVLQRDVDVQLELAPELLCGLELNLGGHAFGWNARDQLLMIEAEYRARQRGSQAVEAGLRPSPATDDNKSESAQATRSASPPPQQ